jgi:hypothetical protein
VPPPRVALITPIHLTHLPFLLCSQSADFHPSCVGHVTARHPAYCVVNSDIYVSNKLLEHLPAPIRVGRTQLRVTVKNVSQGCERGISANVSVPESFSEQTRGHVGVA